jgi:hypothetical protein
MPPHSGRNNQLNRSAYKLGGLIAAGVLEELAAVDALAEAGRACGLSESEIDKTIRSGLAAGQRSPRTIGGAA